MKRIFFPQIIKTDRKWAKYDRNTGILIFTGGEEGDEKHFIR